MSKNIWSQCNSLLWPLINNNANDDAKMMKFMKRVKFPMRRKLQAFEKLLNFSADFRICVHCTQQNMIYNYTSIS